jgi:gluconokinase
MPQYITGVDIGTGSAKAVAIDNKGKVIAVSQFFYSSESPQPGYSEQDPGIIWHAFVKCIKEIDKKLKHVPFAVSLSSCMHSLIVVDKNNEPATNVITWADTRSEKIAEKIRHSKEAESIYKKTGTPIHSMSPLCKITWLRENEPKVFKNAFKFVSIKEFIWYRLFNEYQIDYSIASATGLFDIETHKWNDPSLRLCNISPAQLSEIVATTYTRNDIQPAAVKALGINSKTVFCIGASDGCLANIGSYATNTDTAAITIGTSGAVRIAGATPVYNFNAMIFNYILDDKTFICGGPTNNGGNVVTWFFKTFLKNDKPSEKDYKSFFKSLHAIPAGCEGLLFLPYLEGERAPVWDEKSSGVFFGIKSFHTNAHFLRAAIEGICFSLKDILEVIEKLAAPVNRLNVSGGFVHSKIWMQILSDITGKKLCLMQTEDASSIGAAMLYMKSKGIIKEYSSLPPAKNITITPNLNSHKIYEKYYSVFKNLYESLKKSMHQLHEISE